MSRLTRILGTSRTAPSRTAPSVNREGYPAWERSPEEQYVQTLLTNTFGATYYVSQKGMIEEAAQMHRRMVTEDPEFVEKALVYARQEGLMRSQPVFGLATLAAQDTAAMRRAFNGVVRTPGDLFDFLASLKSIKGNHGGRAVKSTIASWLMDRVNEYWAIKYGGAKKGNYSLRDAYRISHPKGSGSDPLVNYLVKGEADLSTLPQLAAFEALKRASTDAEKIKAIQDGKLPHEVATTFAGSSQAVWDAIVPNMPIMALMKNLATLERHGVIEPHRQHILDTFTSKERIAKSKILPFRFLLAAEKLSTPYAVEAMREAMELSFGNLPDLPGRTCIALDVSGSMSGRFLRVGAIFAIALMKKTSLNGRFFLFDHELREAMVSMRDSILSQASTIHARGGTDTSLPVRALLKEKDKVDNFILITDEQQNTGRPMFDVLSKYKSKVNPELRTFIIDVAPYRNALTPNVPNTYYVYGWSPKVLDFIGLTAKGFDSIADHIRTR